MRRLVTAAVLLVVSGPLLACTSAGSSAPSARPGSLVVQSDVGLPEPTAGLRWVVADGIAFQVPTDWSDTDLGCEYDLDRPAVVYHSSHWFACRHLDVTRYAPSVQVLDANDRQVRTWRRRATVPVPGLDATRSAVVTQGNGKSRAALVPAGSRQLLLVEAAEPAGVEAILATFRNAPAGVAGVPDVALLTERAARSRLEAAGHGVAVRRRPGVYEAGRVVAAEPAVGTPVTTGSTVTITVSTGPARPIVDDSRFAADGRTLSDPGPEPAAYPKAEVLRHVTDWGDGKAVQISLRRVTWEIPEPGVQGLLVWVVTQPDTVQFRSHPIQEKPVRPGFFMSDWFTFYDATTGRMLLGGTI